MMLMDLAQTAEARPEKASHERYHCTGLSAEAQPQANM